MQREYTLVPTTLRHYGRLTGPELSVTLSMGKRSMPIWTRILLGGLLLALTPPSAGAAPKTLACELVGTERPPSDREAAVNQIVFDPAVPFIELRVAQTLGTEEEISFRFDIRPSFLGENKVAVVQSEQALSFAAIRFGVANGLVLDLDSGDFVWSWASGAGSRSYRYLCKR
jgi:hypothetical protein